MNEQDAFELDEIDAQTWHEVLRLRSDVFVVEQQCVYLDPDPEDHGAIHLIKKESGRVIAYARILKRKHWHIGRIIVSKDVRGQGLGKDWVEKAIAICKEKGAEQIEMSAQVYLTEFYGALGFKVDGSMYLEDGIPHVRMCYHHSLI